MGLAMPPSMSLASLSTIIARLRICPWAAVLSSVRSPLCRRVALLALVPVGLLASAGTVGAAQTVTGLTLINADTDQPIAGFNPIAANATLDLATLPTRRLNVRANTSPTTVGSVKFALDS
jgi:hypothetical protein